MYWTHLLVFLMGWIFSDMSQTSWSTEASYTLLLFHYTHTYLSITQSSVAMWWESQAWQLQEPSHSAFVGHNPWDQATWEHSGNVHKYEIWASFPLYLWSENAMDMPRQSETNNLPANVLLDFAINPRKLSRHCPWEKEITFLTNTGLQCTSRDVEMYLFIFLSFFTHWLIN